MNDTLVERIKNGDPSAEEEFCRRFYPRVLILARASEIKSCDVEDIAQDVIEHALTHLRAGKFREEAQLATWVCRIAHNRILDKTSDDEREKAIFVSQDPDPNVKGGAKTLEPGSPPSQELIFQLREALAKIKPLGRILFILNRLEGLTHEEIESRYLVPQGTSGREISAAEEKLRRIL